MSVVVSLIIIMLSVAATELAAIWLHEKVMHGPGWAWHQSHHAPRQSYFEKNDLYAVLFAALGTALFVLGWRVHAVFTLIGVGVTLYGALYALVHDGLVHRRLPLRWTPRRGYLKRLVQAHRLHHANSGREGAVSFGFLWAPPIARLKAQLRDQARGRV